MGLGKAESSGVIQKDNTNKDYKVQYKKTQKKKQTRLGKKRSVSSPARTVPGIEDVEEAVNGHPSQLL